LRRSQAITLALALVVVSLIVELGTVRETPRNRMREEHAYSEAGEGGDESAEALNRDTEYAQARLAPGLVLPGAYAQAVSALTSLPVASGTWAEVTNRPYDADDPRY